MFEKGLREKVAQENTSVRGELGKLQQLLKVRRGGVAPPRVSIAGSQETPRTPSLHVVPGRELCV